MDIKDIVGKALKGEDYAADIAEFTEAQHTELSLEIRKASKVEADAELAKTSALRKEQQRLADKNNPDKKEDTIKSQLRVENLGMAKEKFFANPRYKLSDDKKAQFEEEFKKLDSGKIAPELIMKDLEKAYVAVNSEELLKSKDQVSEFEKNAAEYNANSAGGSSGSGTPDESKYTEAAKALHKSWIKQGIKGKTLDDAQRLTERGEDWKGRNLSS